jgi:hypothetical protein
MTYGNWRDWYGLGRWRKQRRYQLQHEPCCRMCAAEGRGPVAAEVLDHVKHPEGDWNSFWLGETQPLCKAWHSRKGIIEARGYDTTIGIDGMPTDSRHPVYRRSDSTRVRNST